MPSHVPFARAVACAFLLAVTAVAPCRAQSVTVAQGPMVGAITAKSAGVWFRLGAPGTVRVRSHGQNTPVWTYSDPVAVVADSDYTGRVVLGGLLAGKVYTYQVGVTGPEGVETWGGSYNFRTQASAPTAVSFAVLSDFSNKLRGSPALRDALSKSPDFLVTIGDLDHRNPATQHDAGYYPPEDWPMVLDDTRHMHRDTRDFATPIGSDFATGLIGSPNSGKLQIPLYYGWDDHDFCANNADESCPFAAQSVQAYREYYLWSADNGIDGSAGCPLASDFQHFDYGRLLSVFVLDARSARSPDRSSMLGTCQYNWLTNGLANSRSTWKIVLSPVPFNPTMKTWDAWGMFPTERANLIDFIHRKGVTNVVFMSGDVHSGGAVDDGTNSGFPEVSVPHANMPDTWINTFCMSLPSVNAARSEPGLWTIGSLSEPNFGTTPPTCGGVDLAAGTQLVWPAPGVYPLSGKGQAGYARVDVTPTTLDIRVIGSNGVARSGVSIDGTNQPLALHLTTP